MQNLGLWVRGLIVKKQVRRKPIKNNVLQFPEKPIESSFWYVEVYNERDEEQRLVTFAFLECDFTGVQVFLSFKNKIDAQKYCDAQMKRGIAKEKGHDLRPCKFEGKTIIHD